MRLREGMVLVGVQEHNAGRLRVLLEGGDDGWLWDYVEAKWLPDPGEWVWEQLGGGNAPYSSGNSTDPRFELGWQEVRSGRRLWRACGLVTWQRTDGVRGCLLEAGHDGPHKGHGAAGGGDIVIVGGELQWNIPPVQGVFTVKGGDGGVGAGRPASVMSNVPKRRFPWDGEDGQGTRGGRGGRPIVEYMTLAQFKRYTQGHIIVEDTTIEMIYKGISGGTRRAELDADGLAELERLYGEPGGTGQ